MRCPVSYKNLCRGQMMTEYIIVCLLIAIVLMLPYNGRPVYMLVVDAMRLMHQSYMNGLSVYAYPF